MTSLERLNSRLAGKPVDKIPNMNLFLFIIAREAGVSYSEYVQNYRKLVEGNLICAEKYGVDYVCAISGPDETAAFGARMMFPENACPYAEVPLITDALDISMLNHFDPLDNLHTLNRIRACELLRQKVGNSYPVIGWIEGCLAEAADLRGINAFMVDLAGDEEYLAELFEIIFAQQKRFAKAQIDAGADFIGVGNAVASLIGPKLYEKYGFVWDKAIVDYIHEQGAQVKLHICGNITGLLELLVQVGPDIMDIDWMVDFGQAAQMFKGSRTAVSGNLNPAGAILLGNVEQVQSEVRRCISQGTETTLIAGGCEIPVSVSDENLLAMNRILYIENHGKP